MTNKEHIIQRLNRLADMIANDYDREDIHDTLHDIKLSIIRLL